MGWWLKKAAENLDITVITWHSKLVHEIKGHSITLAGNSG
jgi:hypothetical protein